MITYLTHSESKSVIRLLGLLQRHLESEIDSCLMPGERQPRDKMHVPTVALARRRWREAEDIITKLSLRPAKAEEGEEATHG